MGSRSITYLLVYFQTKPHYPVWLPFDHESVALQLRVKYQSYCISLRINFVIKHFVIITQFLWISRFHRVSNTHSSLLGCFSSSSCHNFYFPSTTKPTFSVVIGKTFSFILLRIFISLLCVCFFNCNRP